MSFEETLKKLSEPVDSAHIKERPGFRDKQGNQHYFNYIDWTYAADRLDAICPEWSHRISRVDVVGKFIAVCVELTIAGVTRSGMGVDEFSEEKGLKSAESDALKRAAVKFGIGRELYRKDDAPAAKPSKQHTEAIEPATKIVRAQIIDRKQEPKWKNPALIVKVGDKNFEVKYFLNASNLSELEIIATLGAEINAMGQIAFPIDCFVEMKKSGNYWEVVDFFNKNHKTEN